MPQENFDGIKEHFKWTEDGWYTWDEKAARKTALANRKARIKELRAQGKTVTPFNLGTQLRTLGGIGTDKPQIEILTGGFWINIRD